MLETVELTSGFFKSFDDTEIYYESRGQGQPIVFIYGIACLMNHWLPQINYFSKNFRVITLDLRGHHQSKAPRQKENLTISAIGTDLIYLLKHLQIEKAHFVGHSFGAACMLSAYQQNPDMISSFTFVNGFSKNPIKGMFGLDVVESLYKFVRERFDENPLLMNSLWKAAVDNPITQIASALAGGFNLQLTQFKDIEIYARGVSQIPLEVFLPLFEDMIHFDGNAVAESIKKPTLVISGARDFVTPQKHQLDLHERIHGSQFVKIPYGSHCCQLDFPEYVNLQIEKFVSA